MVTTTPQGRRTAPVTARPRRRKPLILVGYRMPYVPGVVYLTRRAAAKMFDREARTFLGMSGEEFARWYRAGEVADLDHSDVTRVSILLPWADR